MQKIQTLLFVALTAHTAGAQNLTQASIQIEGEFEHSIEDRYEKGKLKSHKDIYQVKDKASGKVYQIKSSNINFKTGDKVKIKGRQDSKDKNVIYASLGGSEVVAPSSITPILSNTFGVRKTLVMMVNFQDNPSQPISVIQAQEEMNQVNEFFKEASYQQSSITYDVYGWFTMPVASSLNCDKNQIAIFARNSVTALGVDITQYQNLIYYFPGNDFANGRSCSNYTWTGNATVGGNPGQSWINYWFETSVITHEMGHNLGLYHSRSLDCGTNVVGQIGVNCTYSEYGDYQDVMGGNGHYNAIQKERLGWLGNGSSPQITTVETSGNYHIENYETVGIGSKALKILKSVDPTTGKRSWYYIEQRNRIGYDSNLYGIEFNSITVRLGIEGDGQGVYWLDMTPTSPASRKATALMPGVTYTDAAAGVSFTTIYGDATGAVIQVSLTCSQSAPETTLSPATQLSQDGKTVTYDLLVKNKDHSACAAQTFNLNTVLPTGLSATIAPQNITLAPGASGIAAVRVNSSIGLASGDYIINVNVLRGSVIAVSTQATLKIDSLSPATPLNLVATTGKRSNVTLTWSASSDINGILRYRIYRNGVWISSSSTTTYTERFPSGIQTYHIVAEDTAGNLSQVSNSVQVGSVSGRGKR